MGGLVRARRVELKELRDELTIALLDIFPNAKLKALEYERDNPGNYHLALSTALKVYVANLVCDINGKYLSSQDLDKLRCELCMKAGAE